VIVQWWSQQLLICNWSPTLWNFSHISERECPFPHASTVALHACHLLNYAWNAFITLCIVCPMCFLSCIHIPLSVSHWYKDLCPPWSTCTWVDGGLCHTQVTLYCHILWFMLKQQFIGAWMTQQCSPGMCIVNKDRCWCCSYKYQAIYGCILMGTVLSWQLYISL